MYMSTPEHTPNERTLADIVGFDVLQGGSGWPHGNEVLVPMLERIGESECLVVLDELEEHVRTMGIAARFKRDKYAGQLLQDASAFPARDRHDAVAGDKLNEAGHKRSVLLLRIGVVRSQILSAFHELKVLRLDIEATNMEDDGTHVPAPAPEKLREGDFLSTL